VSRGRVQPSLAWPALDLAGAALPGKICCERAVWGKVHGAASDHRWVAATPGLPDSPQNSPEEQNLGSPPAPTGDALQICLWGPTASGKTALIAQLFLDFKSSPTEWEIFPTPRCLAFTETMRASIVRADRFPEPTTGGHSDEVVYDFINRQTGLEASLSVEDRAGRDYERLQDGALLDRLAAADGLLLLVDLGREAGQLKDELSKTLDRLHVARHGGPRKDRRPVAVCVSKSDLLVHSPADLRQALTSPKDFAQRHLPQALIEKVDGLYGRYRFFPVSAAGVWLNWGTVEPAVFLDETLTPRLRSGGRPLNLAAPFTWLLDELARER
jgi:Double-GTPase 2